MRALLFFGLAALGCYSPATSGAADDKIKDEIPADSRKEAVASLKRSAQHYAKLTQLEKEWATQSDAIKSGIIDPKVKSVTIPDTIDKKNPIRFPSAKVKTEFKTEIQEKLKGAREELKSMKSDKPEDFARPLSLSKVGEVGRFPYPKVKVASVLNKSQGVVSTETYIPQEDGPTFFRAEDVTVIVSGADTSKWADGLEVPAPQGVFVVCTYKTPRGATRLHLIPLELTKEESAEIMKVAKP